MIKLMILFVILLLTNRISFVLGGIFYMLIARLGMLPNIGSIFRFLLSNPLNLGVVLKLISWVISAGGTMFGIGIYYLLWGMPSDPKSLVLILIFSVQVVMTITHKMLLFDIVSFRDILVDPYRKILVTKSEEEFINDKQIQKKLSNSVFADLYIPKLFELLINFGIMYYCVGRLGIVDLAPNATLPNFFDSISMALSLIPIGFESKKPYIGYAWQIINIFSTMCIFFWTVFFVSLASSLFTEDMKEK